MGLQGHKRACIVITLAYAKSSCDSLPLTENVPMADVRFDEFIPEKVTTLNGIKLPKTKDQ